MTTIADNLQQVHARIAAACAAAQRSPDSVALLAVSKTFGPDAVAEAAAAGQRAFGENYIQEGVEKILALRTAGWPSLEWHCIGPIQSNKTRLVAEHFDWVHTIDRLKIAERLSAQRPPELPPLQVCIQVNVDGGSNKSGVPPSEALALAAEVARLPRLTLRGVMSIPEPSADSSVTLRNHQAARQVWEQISSLPSLNSGQFDTLSLGMTSDLEAAIKAKSSLVRVGVGVFGRREVSYGGMA